MLVPSFVKTPIIGARACRTWLVVVCLALLSGCSLLRLTYPQLPTIAYWWLDGYADFSSAQSERVRDELAAWLRWNRGTQLPDYAALLQRARAEVQANTTAAQVCRLFDDAAARLSVAYEQVLPAAAEIVLTLTPAQLDHIQRRFEKGNADFRTDFLQSVPEERLQASVKRTVERSETLYGKLDDPQRERIARGAAASPYDPERWLVERQQRQRDILQTLRRLQAERASPAQAQAALRGFAERAQQSPNEAYSAYQRRLKQYNCEFAAQVHNSTTPVQRQAAAATLAGWENDLRVLAAEPAR